MPGHDSKQGRSFLLDENAEDQLTREAGRANLLDAPAEPEDKGAVLRRMVSAVDATQQGIKKAVSQVRATTGAIVDAPGFREQFPRIAGTATMADLALHWGTALFGAAAGTVAALGRVATAGDAFGSPETTQEAIANIPEIFAETADALTLGPLTPQGQKASEITDVAIKILAKMRKGAGQWVFEQTGSPAQATMMEVVLAGGTMTFPVALLGRKRSQVKPDETPAPKMPDQPDMIMADAVRAELSTKERAAFYDNLNARESLPANVESIRANQSIMNAPDKTLSKHERFIRDTIRDNQAKFEASLVTDAVEFKGMPAVNIITGEALKITGRATKRSSGVVRYEVIRAAGEVAFLLKSNIQIIGSPKLVPVKVVAAVERGHIQRAHRLASSRGITYGEAIREVISQTKNPASMQHLVPKKGPRELLIGEDTRTYGAMKDSLFEDSIIPLADPTAAAVAGKLVGKRPVVPDISIITKDFTAMVAPHKFLGDRHPILKWGIDKIDRGARNVEAKTNDILWGVELVPERFGTARREGVPHKSDRGALVVFERLPLKDQIKLLDDMQEANLAGREVTEAVKSNWSGLMRVAHRQIRLGTDTVLNEVNVAAKITGGTGIQRRAGYLPAIWTGDFRVFIRNSKGKPVKVIGAKSRRQANAIKQVIEQDTKGYTGSVEAVKRKGKESQSIEAFHEAIRSLKQGTPEAQLLEKTFNDILARRGFGKHRLQRKGVEGFMGSEGGLEGVRSFIKSYQFYVDGGLRYAENMKAFHETNKLFSDPDMIRAYPNTLEALRKWREHSVGARGKVDEVISNWTRNTLGETAVGRVLGRVNQITLITKLFMWNGRFIAAQGIQPFQVIPAKLVNLSSQDFRGSVLKSIAQANKSFFFPDAGAVDSIRFAVQNGTIAPKFVKELQDVLVSNKASWMTGDVPGLLTGQRLAGRVEEYSRMMANLQFYHFLKNSNVPHRTAVESAAYLTDKYMVEYSTIARPMIYGSKGLGTLGKPVGLFKTFQHNYLAQMVEHVQFTKKTGKPAGLAVFVGSQVLAAGLMGVIGVEVADNMLNAMGQPTLSQMMLEAGVPNWLLWGVPSAAIDVDLTTTLAAPGLGMGDFFSMPGYEYVGKSVAGAINWGVKKARGTQTPIDSMNFWNQVAPTSMKGLVEKHYTREDGLTPHPTKHGYGTFRRNTRAWVARFLSGRTLEESRALKSIWQTTRVEDRERVSIDQLVDLSAWAMGNDEDIPDWVFNSAIDDFGVRPRAFQRMVKDRYNKASMTLIEQYTNFEKSRRGRLRADRLERMGATDPVGEAQGRGGLLD